MESKKHIPALRFDWLTKIYNPIVAYTMPEHEFKTALIDQANLLSHHKVLDFGVGTATLSLLVKQRFKDISVIGIDVDDKVLAIAQNTIEKENAKITLIKYDGVSIPFTDNQFDRVVTSLVFHHLDNEQKVIALEEIYRVLKPGGELHIADWGLPSNFGMRLLFYSIQLLDGFKATTGNVEGNIPHHMHDAGFKEVDIKRSFNTIFGTLQLFKGVKR